MIYFIIKKTHYRWFNANHVHGTIMPRQSSIHGSLLNKTGHHVRQHPRDAPGPNYIPPTVSNGEHKVLQKKDVTKALERKQVRVAYEARTQYWCADDEEMLEV